MAEGVLVKTLWLLELVGSEILPFVWRFYSRRFHYNDSGKTKSCSLLSNLFLKHKNITFSCSSQLSMNLTMLIDV